MNKLELLFYKVLTKEDYTEGGHYIDGKEHAIDCAKACEEEIKKAFKHGIETADEWPVEGVAIHELQKYLKETYNIEH